MKKDGEIKLLQDERTKGVSQKVAAARAGVSERTARKYEQAGKLPSQMKQPRTHRTRDNPFATDWPWVEAQVRGDPALQTKTLFASPCAAYPGRYQAGQLRTLQRQVQAWRVRGWPRRRIMFPQQHQPGRMAQSDFTAMNALGVSLAGTPFPHLVYHLMLTYSNVEAVRVCFSESFEALAEGLEACLWQIGGVPAWHRTDNLTAAVRDLDRDGRPIYPELSGVDGPLRHATVGQHGRPSPPERRCRTIALPLQASRRSGTAGAWQSRLC